jgi:hypothetical protein
VIGLLLVAQVALHVEEARDVSRDEIDAVVSNLREALTSVDRAPMDESVQVGSCRAEPACMTRLREGADDVLLVRIFGAVTTIGLVLERVPSSGASTTLERSLVGDERARATAIRDAVKELFPRLLPTPPKGPPSARSAELAATTPVSRDRSARWFMVGGAVAAGAASAILWGMAASDLAALQSKLSHAPGEPITGITYDGARSDADSISLRRNASGALLAVAVVGALGGLLWIWLGD